VNQLKALFFDWKTKVLYLDFELSDKQFEIRYSNNYDDHYSFPDYFFRAEIDPEADVPEGKFEETLYASMETAIKETESRILIVDNITWSETERPRCFAPDETFEALNSTFQFWHSPHPKMEPEAN
jgi:hypothetical protein